MNDEQVKEVLQRYDGMRELLVRMNANMQQVNSIYSDLKAQSGNLEKKLMDIDSKADKLDKRIISDTGIGSGTGAGSTPEPKSRQKQPITPPVKPAQSLKEFFESQGLEVVDKRPSGGRLWITGDETKMRKAVSTAKEIYSANGGYASGGAIKGRHGWWTDSKR